MARLAAWLPILLKELEAAVAHSPLVGALKESKGLEQARTFCLDLWPFIKELPENIARVKATLPIEMEAARLLLAELCDDENVYRSLFVKQCHLAGLSDRELRESVANPKAKRLNLLMKRYCQSDEYAQGMLAIVTAELAATAAARVLAPVYEQYFEKHQSEFGQDEVAIGMEWLRLHARTQTRNALLLTRAISDLDQQASEQLPETVKVVLEAIVELWHCPATGTGPGASLEGTLASA